MMNSWRIQFLTLLLFRNLDLFGCLKILEMVAPTHKLVGDSVLLRCKFDMEGDTLYSVKWYRNEQEFFRYVPNDRPKLQIFPQEGIRVERNKSGKHSVYLTNLELEASGNYRCEVSAEAPSFRTKHEEKLMVVVQEPFQNEIIGLKPSYNVGDLVNVTCYSRGSSPPAELAWKVNDDKIYDERSSGEVSVSGASVADDKFDSYQYQYDNRAGSYTLLQPKVAEPQFLFGTIKDWFGKHSEKLDTAASNLHFYVQEHHKHTGLKLECTASIGPAYWHMNQESCTVTERAPDYTSWMSGTGESCRGGQALVFIISSFYFIFHFYN